MVTNLKFSKFDDAPWGFRLVGGTDFEIPLTVIKVSENSLAEKAGLMEGDVIVRINDTPTSNLTHLDAHALLKQTGNNFMVGVLRNNDSCSELNKETSQSESFEHQEMSESFTQQNSTEQVSVQSVQSVQTEMNIKSKMHYEEHSITDETIAEIMSGEAEVLKDHNIIGVNFKKIIPQSGMIKNSEVFHQLNKEALKTKEEWDSEQKKWSTFLQKPDRPIPKKKNLIEEKKIENAYKVQIVKQPKPRVAPGRTPTPTSEPVLEILENSIEEIHEECQNGHCGEEPEVEMDITVEDNEVPDLNQTESNEISRSGTSLSNRTDTRTCTDYEYYSREESRSVSKQENHETKIQTMQKSEDELFIEKQLYEVKQQLNALSNLPITIQAALNEVQRKLSLIVPTISQIKESKITNIAEQTTDNEMIREGSEYIESSTIENYQEVQENKTTESEYVESSTSNTSQMTNIVEEEELTNESSVRMTVKSEETKIDTNGESNIEEAVAKTIIDATFCVEKPGWQYKREEEKEELELEHKQRLIQERTPKRPAHRAFGPLTPQERPIALPGGRKWRTPKDAFNEEFIAEILSSQAELIIGTTLGKSYESPLLGYDERVNFLKYQKPEKKNNIQNSEVYRMIHHLDAEPKRGVEVRPEKIAAIQDIRVS